MRRGRILIFVFLIIVIGLVVAFLVVRQLLLSAAPEEQAVLPVDVYIAGQNIPQGEKITEPALTTITIPQDKVVAVMFTREELPALLGKSAKFPLDQGVVITESMVGDSAIPISGPKWASLIPAGMTAISIPTDRLALSGYAVSDGAHVNINACFLFVDIDPSFQSLLPNLTAQLTGTGITAEGIPMLSLGVPGAGPGQGRLELDPSVQQPYYLIPAESQRPRLACQMLLQDVVVMRSGNFPLDPNAGLSNQSTPSEQQQAPVNPDIVTLLVSPQDSITLSYLMYTNAKLSMTLRNPVDQARQATEAATLQFLLSQYNIPVPAKLPYSFQPTTTNLTSPALANDAVTVPQ